MLTIKQVAEKLRKSERTILDWIKKGKLQAQKHGRAWQVSEAALQACLGGSASVVGNVDNIITNVATKLANEVKQLLSGKNIEPDPVVEENKALRSQVAEQKQQIESLRQENAQVKQDLAKIQAELELVKAALQSLLVAKPAEPVAQQPAVPSVETKPSHAEPAGLAKPDAPSVGTPDDNKAEKWARENVSTWIDSACPFQKASGRSWRTLALDQGSKIEMKGKETSPRAYLHAIEKWQTADVWLRVKAKVALETVKNNGKLNHYNHPNE